MAAMIDRAAVDAWLEAYVAAWKRDEGDAIGDLFSADVEYRFHPSDEPVRGRDSVVAAWLGEEGFPDAPEHDEPGTFGANYRTIAVDGDTAVAVGTSTYTDSPGGRVTDVYDNCFVLRFDAEGRCREYTEWYVRRPEDRS